MMQRITIRFVFLPADDGETISVDLKPAESILSISPWDANDMGYTVAIAGPREDIAPEG